MIKPTLQASPVPFDEIRTEVKNHLYSLAAPIDSFVEDNLIDSTWYRLYGANGPAGLIAHTSDGTCTAFIPASINAAQASSLFILACRQLELKSALLPTLDTTFLHAAVDAASEIRVQACLFRQGDPGVVAQDKSLSVNLAEPANADAITRLIGDFIPDVPATIARNELYTVHEHGRLVALGVIATGRLYPGVASIGMFVGVTDRNRGLGAQTIRLLRSECARLGLEAVAGCAASNVASRATLERAGMMPTCRLLRIQLDS